MVAVLRCEQACWGKLASVDEVGDWGLEWEYEVVERVLSQGLNEVLLCWDCSNYLDKVNDSQLRRRLWEKLFMSRSNYLRD